MKLKKMKNNSEIGASVLETVGIAKQYLKRRVVDGISLTCNMLCILQGSYYSQAPSASQYGGQETNKRFHLILPPAPSLREILLPADLCFVDASTDQGGDIPSRWRDACKMTANVNVRAVIRIREDALLDQPHRKWQGLLLCFSAEEDFSQFLGYCS